MALNLDTRQRAMLEAMGITVWLPQPAEVAATPLASTEPEVIELRAAEPATALRTEKVIAAAQAPVPIPAPAPTSTPARATERAPTILPAYPRGEPHRFVQQPAAGPAGEPGLGWTISPAQLVYPHAPQHVQASEQGGWLILLEPAANPPLISPAQKPTADSAQTALQGDAARLLDNMLRALKLQEKPRIFSAALHRAPPDADLSHAQPLQPALETLLREVRPECVLVLGLASARAVLGRHDALGRLRSEPHRIAGVPTIVTYDPNYLLRAPQAKAGAWADLVQANAFTKTT